ncbi:MAG: YfhO family protein, partial [Clostridia bacterium]|nr:YfhO family protein [Clostridia bacterium]
IIPQVALALSYGYCGYLFVSNTYINWVDLLIYLPFVCLGFKKLMQTGKKAAFVVPYALMVYTCFSISCFSMLLVYPIAVVYCVLVIDKQERKKALTNLVLAFVCIIIFSLPILLPSLIAFLVSGRKTGLFENLMASYSAEALYKKISYIFTDSLTLFFTVAYFVKNGVKRPIDRFLAITLGVLFIPIVFDEACNLLNFGSYMSYSLRFGFLNGFYFLYVAASYLSCAFVRLEQRTDDKIAIKYAKRIEKGEKLKDIYAKNNLLFSLITAAAAVCAIVGMVILSKVLGENTFTSWFSSRFAHSLGGLEGTVIIFAIVALIALLGTLLVKFKRFSAHVFSIILLIVICFQTAVYTDHLVFGNLYVPTAYNQIKAFTDHVEELEGNDHTRVKMNGDYLTADMPFTLHTNSFSVFSSVTDSKNFIAPNFFDYGGNGMNSMKSYNGKFLSDCIFGYKYVITEGNSTRSYLEKVKGYNSLTDEQGNVIDVGDYVLYKNGYAFPHAFVVKNDRSDLDVQSLAGGYDHVLKMLGGADFAISWVNSNDISITEHKAEGVPDGVFKVKIKLSERGNYFFTSQFDDGLDLIYCRSAYEEEKLTSLNNNPSFSLGYGSSGSYSVFIKSANEKPLDLQTVAEACSGFYISDNSVKQLYSYASSQEVEFSIRPNVINVKATAGQGEYLFLNYVALPGHEYYVNGKIVQPEDNLLSFMLIPLEEGENEVEIVYTSPYIAYTLMGLAAAIVLAFVYWLVFIRFKKPLQLLQKTISILAILVASVVAIFFLIMPLTVCIVKNAAWLMKWLISLL